MTTKIDAQRLGVGVGFLARHLIGDLLARGELVALPCSVPRPNMPLYMAWRKDNDGRALAWFVEACGGIDWFASQD